MTKVRIIRAKTPEELVEKMNNEQFFASQPMQDKKDWICFVYSDKPKEVSLPKQNELATEKQVSYLRSLGMEDIPEGLTKQEASKLIEEQQRY